MCDPVLDAVLDLEGVACGDRVGVDVLVPVIDADAVMEAEFEVDADAVVVADGVDDCELVSLLDDVSVLDAVIDAV